MGEHHDPYGGSRLAQWAICPHWESGPSGPEAQRGTRIHAAVATSDSSKLIDDDVQCYYRCISYLEQFRQDHPEWTILQEKWMDGVIEGTGGTADVLAWNGDMAVVIDWKGSDNAEDSAQGKSYALNAMVDLGVHSVRVVFFNYTSGVAGSPAEYNDKAALACEIERIKNDHIHRELHRKMPNPGCSWCANKATCKEASEVTTADLTVTIADSLDVNAMPIQQAGIMYLKLAALIKRAKKIEAALNDRITKATESGEQTGFKVGSKGGQRSWRDEDSFSSQAQKYADDAFLKFPTIRQLLPPGEMEKALIAEWGVAHTDNIRLLIGECTDQLRYTTLTKEK